MSFPVDNHASSSRSLLLPAAGRVGPAEVGLFTAYQVDGELLLAPTDQVNTPHPHPRPHTTPRARLVWRSGAEMLRRQDMTELGLGSGLARKRVAAARMAAVRHARDR